MKSKGRMAIHLEDLGWISSTITPESHYYTWSRRTHDWIVVHSAFEGRAGTNSRTMLHSYDTKREMRVTTKAVRIMK